jgi:hypothetical protein
MTLQEIFDKAATHLIAQNAQSVRRGACQYLGPGGLRCAAGVFIPEDKYEPRFEGRVLLAAHADAPVFESDRQVSHDLMRAIGIEAGSPEACLLRGCQMIHDYTHAPAEWPQLLTELAALWDLNTDALAAAIAKREGAAS